MSDCLPNDIDDYLEAQALAELGNGGLYSTLQVQQVIIDQVWDLDKAKRDELFPLVLILGMNAQIEPGAHGGGIARLKNTYPYIMLAALQADTKRQCRRDVHQMRRRLRNFFRTRLSLDGLASSDGEQVQKLVFENAPIEVWGRADQDIGPYTGVTWIEIKIQTEG